jgi:hypothetical protein
MDEFITTEASTAEGTDNLALLLMQLERYVACV